MQEVGGQVQVELGLHHVCEQASESGLEGGIGLNLSEGGRDDRFA